MRSRRYASILIAGYLAFQVLYPIRGLIRNKFDTWGMFTWNMYSQGYDCQTQYKVIEPSGRELPVDFRKYFVLPDKAGHVLNRAALPAFHKFLCGELAREGKNGRTRATVVCRKNGVAIETLVDSTADICSAPNFGVTAG
jgi:hypothetical protein